MNGPYAPGFLAGLRPSPAKIAVVRASRLGDYVLATPALRALRGAFPQAEIALLALPLVRDLAARSAFVDRHVVFPGFPGMAEQFLRPGRLASFVGKMRKERFDLAIQLHGTGVYSNPFALLLGARYTVGFIREGDRAGLLDAACPFAGEGHEVERVLSLLGFLGIDGRDCRPEVQLTDEDMRVAGGLLGRRPRPWIGVAPGSREPEKCWPHRSFVAAAGAVQAGAGGTIVFLGTRHDRPAAALTQALPGASVLDLTGRTRLAVLAAVISRLDLLLANDSGAAHLAYAFGTPSVTLFFTTDPRRWGPPAGGPHDVLSLSRPVVATRRASSDGEIEGVTRVCLRRLGQARPA